MANRRLSIAVIPAWYPTRKQPLAGIFVRDQARAAALHADVVIIAADDPVRSTRRLYWLDDRVEDGLRTLRIRYRASHIPQLTALGYLLGIAAALRRLRREGRPVDLLHAHVHRAAWASVLVAAPRRLPVVVTEHSSEFGYSGITPQALRRARFAFRRADIVCPVSDYLRRQIEDHGIHVPFRVVPNAVDTNAFALRDRAASAGPPRIVTVASHVRLKGLDHLLHAAAAIAAGRRDFALDLVGDGPCRAQHEALARELGIDELVKFHGLQPKPTVSELMRRGSLFVLPSLTENLPVSIIEAMACGLPVVATHVGGIPELVDEDTGVLVPPAQPAPLAAAIERVLDNLGDYSGVRIAERARTRYSLGAVGATWDEVYRDVLAARGR
jgi:glycosyltransferase involved in cell wall biosynthesis